EGEGEGESEGEGNGNGKGKADAEMRRVRAGVEAALIRASLRFNLLRAAPHQGYMMVLEALVNIWSPAIRDEVARAMLAWAREVGEEKVEDVRRALAEVAAREGLEGWSPPTGEPERALLDVLRGAPLSVNPYEAVLRLQEAMGKASRVVGVIMIPTASANEYLTIDYTRGIVHPVKRYRLPSGGLTPLMPANPVVLFVVPEEIELRVQPSVEAFAVKWRRAGGPDVVTVGGVKEIVDRLQSAGAVGARNKAHDAVSAILDFAMRQGWVRVVEAAPPGVYIEGEKLRVVWPRGAPPEGDLAAALDVLDELARWYSQEKFATVMKWGIASPLSYAIRKLGGVFTQLVPYGRRDTGKSTLAAIAAAHLWGRDARSLARTPEEVGEKPFVGSGESLASTYRIEQWGSATTFPIWADEANPVFVLGRGQVENSNVLNYLKAAASSVGGRGRRREWGSLAGEEVLAPFVVTLNPTPPVDFSRADWAKTFSVIYFGSSDVLSEERIHDFNVRVAPRLPELAALGRFALEYAAAKGVGWLRNAVVEARVEVWDVLGREILEAAYRAAGREPPAWIVLKAVPSLTQSRREAEEEVREIIIERLQRAIYEAYSEAVRGGEGEQTSNWDMRIRIAARAGTATWLKVITPRGGEYVVLVRGVLDVVNWRGDLQLADMKGLAEVMGWEYGEIHSHDARINTKGIRVPLKEMANLFNGDWELAEG
ncbi:MAG: hypothetical protein ACP5QE_07915, partial [Conexivisphaera sp.]